MKDTELFKQFKAFYNALIRKANEHMIRQSKIRVVKSRDDKNVLFEVYIKGQTESIYLTPKQFQSLKETFQRWIAVEGYNEL
jgi:hypothetical protein